MPPGYSTLGLRGINNKLLQPTYCVQTLVWPNLSPAAAIPRQGFARLGPPHSAGASPRRDSRPVGPPYIPTKWRLQFEWWKRGIELNPLGIGKVAAKNDLKIIGHTNVFFLIPTLMADPIFVLFALRPWHAFLSTQTLSINYCQYSDLTPSSTHHMINGSWIFNSGFARHKQ